MDYMKIQLDCLKAVYNYKYNFSRDTRWLCGAYKDDYIFISDGHVGYFIPRSNVFLNLENMFGDPKSWFHTEHLVDFGAGEVSFTDGLIMHDKDRLCIFKKGDENIYVNEKLLKRFNIKNSIFKGKGGVSPILVFEFDTLVGIVLPTRVNTCHQSEGGRK